jgi:hypothetical protein
MLLGLILLVGHGVAWAEMVTLKTPGGSVRGEVVRVTKSEVILKTSAGKEKMLPLAFLKPKEVYACRKRVVPAEDAQAHFDLGEYCMKHGLKDEGSLELMIAKRLDEKRFGAKADALLKAQNGAPSGTDVAQTKPPKKTEPAKTDSSATKKETPKKEQTVKVPLPDGTVREVKVEGEENVRIKGKDGRIYVIPRQFLVNRENVAARTPEQMKEFLDKRLKELKTHCSGDWRRGDKSRKWRMEETEHFYIFSNLEPDKQLFYKRECEALYKLLSEVLEHKEGEPLWNNKCPIYFLSSRGQFHKFATAIDKSPSAANSGGYFSHRGREVHIVIPVMSRWTNANEPERDMYLRATSTLRHEGTHAFLQLVGENVQLNRWLHEGMAQFIQFWYDAKNNRPRTEVQKLLRRAVDQDNLMSWEESRNRPGLGVDHEGYAFAWSRIIFLYRAFPDKRKLPKMIKLIKSGKGEDEAMAEAFGYPVAKLEEVYQKFIKQHAKTNFRGL